MYQRKGNLKNIKSKFGYGNEKDKTYESTLSDKKKIEFQFQTFIESISKYNSYVSRLVDMGFNLKTLDVIFDIKYLDYQDEYHKLFPNANLQSSKGGAGTPGGGIPTVPTPDQLGEMIDAIFGTRIGPTAIANRNYVAELGAYINARNTELGQTQALLDYTSGTKLYRNNSLKLILANVILKLQDQGVIDFKKSSSSISITMELYNAFSTERLINLIPKTLREVIKKIVNKPTGITYKGILYRSIPQKTELKKIVMNEIQVILNNLKPDDEIYFNQKMGFAEGGGGTMTIDTIMNILSNESSSSYMNIRDGVISISSSATTLNKQTAIQQLLENILNMLSTSSDFQRHMENTKKTDSADDQILKAVNYLNNKIATGGDRSFYVISEYIKKWMRVVMGSSFDNTRSAPLPRDPNAPTDPNAPKGDGDEVRKPTPDMVYELVSSNFPEMDEASRDQLIQYIISINENYNSTRASSSTETQQERDEIETNFLNKVLSFFDSLKSEVDNILSENYDINFVLKPNTVWQNIFKFLRAGKDVAKIVKRAINMTPEENMNYIMKLGEEIYNDMKSQDVGKQPDKIDYGGDEKTPPNIDDIFGDGADGAIDYGDDRDLRLKNAGSDRTGVDRFEGNIKPDKDVYQPEDGTPLPSTPPTNRYRSDDSIDFNKFINERARSRTGSDASIGDMFGDVFSGASGDDMGGGLPRRPDTRYPGDELFGDDLGSPYNQTYKDRLDEMMNKSAREDEAKRRDRDFDDGYNSQGEDVISGDMDDYEAVQRDFEVWQKLINGDYDDFSDEGDSIIGVTESLPELDLTPEQLEIMNQFEEDAKQDGQNATPAKIRWALERMIRRLRHAPTGLRRVVIKYLNNIRTTINNNRIRFNWAFVDTTTNLTYESEEEAIEENFDIMRSQMLTLPRDDPRRIQFARQSNQESIIEGIRKRLNRVIQIEYYKKANSGDDDPPDDDPDDDQPDEANPERRRKTIPIRKMFKLLVSLIAVLGGGFTLARAVKWLDGWVKGRNVEIPKDNIPTFIPKKPDDKKPKPPSTDDSVLPKKFLTIGHTEWFDSVGLSAVIDTYNGFVNEYNEARDDGTISDKDLTFMNKNIREYYDKFAKVTNTPLLSDLQEAKKRYDGLRAQYDNALENGLDINSISVIYTELRQSMTYLDRMTDQFLKMEGGVFGTYKSKDDPDVTVDDADSNIRLVSAPAMDKQARKNKLKSPSDFILSKGMKERIERKLNRQGFGDGVLQEEKLFNDFSIVTPPPIREHNSLTNHNKRHEIMQYAKARSMRPPIKTRKLTKITGQKPRLNNVVQFDDILDDVYYNNPDSTKLQNPYQTKSDNIQQFHKSKLYNPEYSLQKAFENKNNKNMSTGGDMIRSGAYENVNKDQYYQLGTIQYEYNEELNKYPMTRQKPMTINKSNPKQTKPIRRRRIPNSYSLK